MISALLLSLVLYATQCVAGWIVWARVTNEHTVTVGVLARVLIVGPAAVAAQMLAYGLLGIPFSVAAVVIPWWCLLLLTIRTRPPAFRFARPGGVWQLCACGVVAVQVAVALTVGSSFPLHHSDAMNNFALPAMVYASHGRLAPEALAGLTDPGNVAYPPLLAFNQALFFLVDRDYGRWCVQPFSALALLAWALLVAEAVWDRDRPALALMCLICVLMAPMPMRNAIGGYADLRLAASLLLVLLEAQAWTTGGRRGPFRLAVVAAALGMTKVEGYAIAAAVCVFILVRARALRESRSSICGAVALVVIFVAPWPICAAAWGLPSAYAISDAWAALPQSAGNAPAILAALAKATLAADPAGIPEWGWLWPVAIAAGLWRASVLRDRFAPRLLLLLLVHWAGITAMLCVGKAASRIPLAMGLEFTVQRMLLQMLPWLVLLLPSSRLSTIGVPAGPPLDSQLLRERVADQGSG